MAEKQTKGTKGYVTEINKMLRQEFGEVPAKLSMLIKKTAQDMRILDRIIDEIDKEDNLTPVELGSMGQQKTVVNPLLPYYDKMSARVTDDLYNLGLTARKQAQKTEDQSDKTSKDRMNEFLDGIQ